MANEQNELLKIKQDILLVQTQSAKLDDAQKKHLKELQKSYKELYIKIRKGEAEKLNTFASQAREVKSMSSMYSNLSKLDSERIKKNIRYNALSEEQNENIARVAEINREIAQLSSEDTIELMAKNAEYDAALASIGKLHPMQQAILDNLEEQNKTAIIHASVSEYQKSVLQGQLDVYDGIQKTVSGTLDTASLLLSNWRAGIGAILIGTGAVVNKIGDANKELGTTMFQMDGIGREAGALSFIFDDAVQNARDLSTELGGTERASFQTQMNVGLISMNMGISGTEAASLVGSFSRLNENSTSVAVDMITTSREFARQNKIIPAQLMSELAASTEEFALFGKDGGENILRAAGYAAKLGTNMSTLSGITEGLLDFESSITAELELSALLGKNINLNKARQLAYDGDIEAAAKETLKQLGGIDTFNRMDYFQKKQTAELLGVSVAEYQKMVANQKEISSLGDVINSKFSRLGEVINGGLNNYLGTSLQGLGGMVTASAQIGSNFANMGFSIKGIAKGMWKIVLGMGKVVIQSAVWLANQIGIAIAAISSMSAITLGIGAIAIAGGIAFAVHSMKSAQASVNDGIIQNGRIISTHPEDTLIATRSPETLANNIASPILHKEALQTAIADNTNMMAKMDELINAVYKNKDVYMDRDKVTNSVMKTSERNSDNVFGLGAA